MGLIRLLKNDLAKEINAWVDADIISVPQAVTICARYGIDFHNRDKRSLGFIILTSLGYLFLGLALITLIGANWEEIPRGLRMGGLVCLTLATHGMGVRRLHQGATDAAVGFFFLGSLFYGASIMLIAQIYHLGEHYPDGILFWALGVLPLAVLMKSRLLLFLTSALAFTWFLTEASLEYFPLAFPLFLAAITAHLYFNTPSRTLFLVLVTGVGLFLEYSLSWWIGPGREFVFEVDLLAFGVLFFMACYGISAWLTARPENDLRDYGVLLGVWTLRFFILTLFILSFEEPWEELLEAQWQAPLPMSVLALVATGVSLWLSFRSGKSMIAPVLVALGVLAVFFLLVSGSRTVPALLLQVADNFFLVGAGIWLSVQGIRRALSHSFFLGVVTILAIGLIRYMDLVGDYIGAAALFLGFSLILLGTARFWKRHNTGKEARHA